MSIPLEYPMILSSPLRVISREAGYMPTTLRFANEEDARAFGLGQTVRYPARADDGTTSFVGYLLGEGCSVVIQGCDVTVTPPPFCMETANA